MKWNRWESTRGYDWRNYQNQFDYEMFTSVRDASVVYLNLWEWSASPRGGLIQKWQRDLCPFVSDSPTWAPPSDIRKSADHFVEDAEMWADTLVMTYMSALVDGLAAGFLRSKPKIGLVISGWQCVHVKASTNEK